MAFSLFPVQTWATGHVCRNAQANAYLQTGTQTLVTSSVKKMCVCARIVTNSDEVPRCRKQSGRVHLCEEFRVCGRREDLTRAACISDRDMGARHRARAHSIQIMRIEVIAASKTRRSNIKQFHVSDQLSAQGGKGGWYKFWRLRNVRTIGALTARCMGGARTSDRSHMSDTGSVLTFVRTFHSAQPADEIVDVFRIARSSSRCRVAS